MTAAADYAGHRYVFGPLAWTYRLIMPEPVRVHLARAGTNFLYPGRALNNLLQGKLHAAAVETERFAINTTVGVLGLWDPASHWGLHPFPEDFGQTFASWGWKDSTYLYLPINGPSTLRDALGLVPDTFTDIAILDWRISFVREFNRQSDLLPPAMRIVDASYDAYETARTVFELQREVDVTDFSWQRDESGPTQTLEAIFLKAQDTAFPGRGVTRSVRLSKHRKLPYTCWLQPEPAPLVYLVPGFGAHRLSDTTLGLAELCYAAGSSVVAVSSPTNWEFIRDGSSADVPGYAPVDARDVHVALTAIDRELEREHPGRFQARQLAGVSLGAFEALYVAAGADAQAGEGLLDFDLVLALDPPVDLRHALQQLDHCYNAPLAFPAAVRQRRIDQIFGKVLYLSHGDLQPGMELPFTRVESEFLIGLAFRLDLQFTLLQTQDLHDQGVLETPRSWLRRAPAFREASEYSFMEYFYAFVLPYYSRRDPAITFDEAGADRMFEACDLRSISDGLVRNRKVRLFANENDFLLRPEDVSWLRATLDDRATILPAGGHLGNLHRREIQQAIQGIVDAHRAPP